jgi:hypothetical protein
MATDKKLDARIDQYYKTLADLAFQCALHEGAVSVAFQTLRADTARSVLIFVWCGFHLERFAQPWRREAATHARGAHANRNVGMSMAQSMHPIVSRIKSVRDDVEIGRVRCFVAPEY